MSNYIPVHQEDSPARRAVLADLRDPIAKLRQPVFHARWREELSAIVRELEEQFSCRAADLAVLRIECFRNGDRDRFFVSEAEYLHWKAKATGFKRHVVNRLQEVNRLIKEQNIKEDHDLADRRYQVLRRAIRVHRAVVQADYEPTAADVALWEVLEEVGSEDESEIPALDLTEEGPALVAPGGEAEAMKDRCS